MQRCQFVFLYSCVCRLKLVLLLAGITSLSDAGPAGPRVSQIFVPVKNFISVKVMLAVGAYCWHPEMWHTCYLYSYWAGNSEV